MHSPFPGMDPYLEQHWGDVHHNLITFAQVHRGWKAKVEIYRLPLRERLPVIRVPLRQSDTDVPLDLQALIAHVYRHGRYDDIDYTQPPAPPLDGPDAAWADELLRSAGKRSAGATPEASLTDRK